MLQIPLQIPLEQVGVAILLLEQPIEQPPQVPGLLAMFDSQPSVSLLLLQSANPAAHVPVQTPPVHVGVGMLFPEQTLGQAPQ